MKIEDLKKVLIRALTETQNIFVPLRAKAATSHAQASSDNRKYSERTNY